MKQAKTLQYKKISTNKSRTIWNTVKPETGKKK
jgi:hypothetical protein